MLFLLLSCASADKPADAVGVDTAPETGDTGDATATCAPDHARLDLAPEVLDAVYVPEWSYEAWQLDLWLNANGLSWLAPTRNAVSTWRVRYTTQDRGAVVEATALVSVPVLAGEAEVGTVLWLHGTSGFEDACAPSVGAVEGLAPAIVSAARGYVAVAPDYLGLNGIGDDAPDPHPWIVGEPTGLVALDALRAVDAWLPESGLAARVDRARIVYWGWSEGGYTALQADRHAPSYAPEHVPVGVISAVPPVDIVGQLAAGASTFGPASRAGALILYFHGLWHGEGTLADVLQADVAAALPGEVPGSCTTWPSVDDATAVSDIYTPAFVEALAAGEPFLPWTCQLARSSLPTDAVPYEGDAPVLLVTGTGDTLVPAGPVHAAIPALCDEGYRIEHVACEGAEHGEAPVLTLREQVSWLDARMAGEAAAEGCGVAVPAVCDG